MRTVAATVTLALVLAPAAGCGGGAPPDGATGERSGSSAGADSAFFAERWASYAEALQAEDVGELVSWFTEDAQLMEPGLATIRGRSRIRSAMGSALDQVDVPRAEILPGEVRVHGDRAYELGSYTEVVRPASADSSTTYHGRYAAFWRRAGGEWKVSRLMLNQLPAAHGGADVPSGETAGREEGGGTGGGE